MDKAKALRSLQDALKQRWDKGAYGECMCGTVVLVADKECMNCSTPYADIEAYGIEQCKKLLQNVEKQIDEGAADSSAGSSSGGFIAEDWSTKPSSVSKHVFEAFRDHVKVAFDKDKKGWNESSMGKTPWECMFIFTEEAYKVTSQRKTPLVDAIRNAKGDILVMYPSIQYMIENGGDLPTP